MAAGLATGMVTLAVIADVLAQRANTTGATGASAWVRRRMVVSALDARSGAPELGAGEVASRIIAGGSACGRIIPLVSSAVRTVLTAIAALALLGTIDPLLPLVLLVGAPIGYAVLRPFTRRSTDASTAYQEAQGRIADRLVDALAGLRTIRASGTVDQEVARILSPLPELRAAGLRSWELQRGLAVSFGLLTPALHVAVIGAAGWALAVGRISPGQLIAAVGYAALALGTVDKIDIVVDLAGIRAGAARVVDFVRPIRPAEGEELLPSGVGEIRFDDVSVRRAGVTVLDQVSLRVAAGSTVAIVGPSGSGKSALTGLLGRMVEPDAGRVLIDGHDIAELTTTQLRQAVAYGFERPVLLGQTVADAIAYARPAVPAVLESPRTQNMDRGMDVLLAATAAHADEFIRRLPLGYHTPVVDAPLSGGEQQRLGLARAVAQGARVLVLDDATSSLDTATEANVVEALSDALSGRTKLVVAHRAATAARADRVAWFVGGRLLRVDTHARLWRDPSYRTLFSPAADDLAEDRTR
ncbi:ABC transporter ATP-binding protein [Tenggerimyces flavus]|uniref:ABC transporter ATP-binding protein n=1 Tax=Tenggerimyces flavus TaxID=1708749 RepID=A0ABV7YDF2_9ACTN|nr:ABC transporter ATP-binding protein [Tenggerimyces flavus]MBM7790267.1 ATP-binding cassette subfamily B protein [Tenggerimyces flavus]